MFFEVRPPYWLDVISFLNNNLCSILEIDQLVEDLKIEVYPNPSTSTIYINVSNDLGPYTVCIYNIMGQNVYSAKLNGSKDRVILPEQPGIYILEIQGNNVVQSLKVVKE